MRKRNRDVALNLRITAGEKKSFELAAAGSGISLTCWIRERLRSASRRELIECGRQVPFIQEIWDANQREGR